MGKKSSHDLGRIIVSIIYIVLGGLGTVSGVKAILGGFAVGTLLALAASVVMLVAGVLGLLNAKPGLCRLLGLIIFAIAVVSLVLLFIGSGLEALKAWGTWVLIAEAIVAWYFVICIKGKK